MDKVAEGSRSRFSSLAYPEWLLLLAGLGLLTITEQYRWFVTVGLVLMGISFGLRAWRSGHLLPRMGLEIPALLFLLSAGVATWISYDRSAALLQFVRILAAGVLLYAVVDSGKAFIPWLAGGVVAAASYLAVYWPTQFDFSAGAAKFPILQRLGGWLAAHLPSIPGPSIHPNVAAGTLALALPFCAALVWYVWQKRSLWLAAGFLACGGLMAFGLILTSSRGGWVAVAVTVSLAALVWLQKKKFPSPIQRWVFWGGLVAIVLILFVAVVATGQMDRLLGSVPDPNGTIVGRTELWRQGLGLIRDYVYTGSGLMSFHMVYSMYEILIHVPYYDHLHNTYLEVWLEQGIFGVIAMLWAAGVIGGWAWKALGRTKVSIWGWAGLAGLSVLAVHGVFDVVFYVTRTLPLVGLAAGFCYLLKGPGSGELQKEPKPILNSRAVAWVAAILTLLVLVLVVFHRPLLGAWYGNLGAIYQTHVELTRYDPAHFDDPTIDLVRRTADLSWAEQQYQKALALDSTNRTALQRLSEIALSRGQYAQALVWMQAAWQAGYRDAVTRMLLGDAWVANGQVDAAVEVVRGLTWAENRLLGQAWYRYWLGVPPGNPDYPRAANAWRAALLLNPENITLENWISQAESH